MWTLCSCRVCWLRGDREVEGETFVALLGATDWTGTVDWTVASLKKSRQTNFTGHYVQIHCSLMGFTGKKSNVSGEGNYPTPHPPNASTTLRIYWYTNMPLIHFIDFYLTFKFCPLTKTVGFLHVCWECVGWSFTYKASTTTFVREMIAIIKVHLCNTHNHRCIKNRHFILQRTCLG